MTDEQPGKVKSLEGATLPEGTIQAGKPAIALTAPEAEDVEEQRDQPGDPDASDDDREADR